MLGLYDRVYGLARSLRMYYGDPGQAARLAAFYAAFVRPGALCFDVGAHVGNRSRCWSRLGARVVALEPQPDFARFLRLLFRRDPRVTVLQEAVGAAPGRLVLHISPRTPTVTTGSPTFIDETRRVPGFAWVEWSRRLEVPMTTLDRLIDEHGEPDFVKIDVEGMEHEVLAGLSRPVRALSFEFLPANLSSALASLERLEALGDYRLNVSLGEAMRLQLGEWADVATVRRWLQDRDPESDSGDIYAVRADQTPGR